VASLATLRRLAFGIRLWPDPDETQIAVTRRLLEKARLTVPSEPVDTEYGLRQYRSLLAQALIHRGHLRDARRIVENRFQMPEFMTLAELGVIPPDSVEAVLGDWFENPEQPGVHLLFPWCGGQVLSNDGRGAVVGRATRRSEAATPRAAGGIGRSHDRRPALTSARACGSSVRARRPCSCSRGHDGGVCNAFFPTRPVLARRKPGMCSFVCSRQQATTARRCGFGIVSTIAECR